MKTLLHVGCGPKRKDRTTAGFNSPDWQEVRLDIDESVQPDVIGTMTAMPDVADGSIDAIFSSHNIEHLYPHEVPLALAEFLRVLNPTGFAVITCPDLQSVCALVAQDRLTEPAYTSPAGPIAPLDILYGHRPPMAQGNLYMAHRCGFTRKVLDGTLRQAGFAAVGTMVRPPSSTCGLLRASSRWMKRRYDRSPPNIFLGHSWDRTSIYDDDPMNPAIFYHPEAYTTSGPKLMGRNAAGESFLRGFLAHSRNSIFWVQAQNQAHIWHFAEHARAMGRPEQVHGVEKGNLSALAQPGLVYHPGPGIGAHAWQRGIAAARAGESAHAAWSLCGITHTTSSAGAMDALAELLTAPVQPWDAVICTSTAVRNNAELLLESHADYLRQRLGASRIVRPQLPVIPLGIHTADFVYSDAQRQSARKQLGADDKTHIVVYVGRLSFHAKAHPLAMYQALEASAQSLPAGERILLVECGWHANDHLRDAFKAASELACPSVRTVLLDGREAENRQTAWAGADVFCSLSDNIQETFGIVPIEAMAAGLPVVVSDWDGYKDTVRHGVDGFRIATIMPRAGLGTDLALRHALEIDTYDMYCGHSSSLVAVDVAAAHDAFDRLFASPELRRTMGEAGRARAQAVYDWKAVIAQYEALWDELNAMRAVHHRADQQLPPSHPWPARLDPYYAFSSYPTHMLAPETMISLRSGDLDATIERMAGLQALAMVNYAKYVIPADTELREILAPLAAGPKSALQLISALPSNRRPQLFRAIVWLLKLGLVTVEGEVQIP